MPSCPSASLSTCPAKPPVYIISWHQPVVPSSITDFIMWINLYWRDQPKLFVYSKHNWIPGLQR